MMARRTPSRRPLGFALSMSAGGPKKTVVVTGGSKGIGLEMCRQLLADGNRVITMSRSEPREALDGLELVKGDLTDLKSVSEAVKQIREKVGGEGIDKVICNAGVMFMPAGETKDGFESTMGINHFGHQLFCDEIMPELRQKSGQLIMLSSTAALGARSLDAEEDAFLKKPYNSFDVYCKSKAANAVAASIMDKEEDDVTAVSIHPGVVNSDLFRNVVPSFVTDYFEKRQDAKKIIGKLFGLTSTEDSASYILATFADEQKVVPGEYYLRGQPRSQLVRTMGDQDAGKKFIAESREMIEAKLRQ